MPEHVSESERDWWANALTEANAERDAAIARAEKAEAKLAALGAPVVEHARLMSGGGWHLRYENDWVRKNCPLAGWIRNGQRFGGTVGKRTVIVVEDWAEIRDPGLKDIADDGDDDD